MKKQSKPKCRENAAKPTNRKAENFVKAISDDLEKRVETLAAVSVKAADVLKHLLSELNSYKDELSRLADAKLVDVVKTDSVMDAVKHIGEALDDETVHGACRHECCHGTPFREDLSGTALVQMLFRASKYAIDPGEMLAYRHPEMDDGNNLCYEFVAHAERESDGVTFSFNEGFFAFLYPELNRSVREFDEKVGNLVNLRFLTKEENDRNKAPERNEAVRAYKDFVGTIDRKECSCKCGKCKCHGKKEKKGENAAIFLKSPPQLKVFKEYLMDNSRYIIPSTRFQILADRVDRKSQKFVYELRFFQTNFKKAESYESVPLRIKMNGDCDERILKRFDKAVADLKFNAFKEKKNVR